MKNDHQAGYYAVIPAPILNNEGIPAGAKLLYATLSQLINETGYCFATNQYLMVRHNVSDRSVRYWLNALEQAGAIRIEITREAARNQEAQRKIFIIEGGAEKNFLPGGKKFPAGAGKKFPVEEESINNTPYKSPKGDGSSCFDFAAFWSIYGLKTGKTKCEAAYRRIPEADREKIKAELPRYVAATFTDGRFPSRKYPLTWINGHYWEDEGPTAAPGETGLNLFSAEEEAARRKELEAF